MDTELQAYYEARIALFAEKGWKDLIEDVVNIRNSVDTISGIPDAASLHFKQGELSILSWLINLEDNSNHAYEELKAEYANSNGL